MSTTGTEYTLGVDLGTTYTAAAVRRGGRTEVVALGGRTSAVPSVVLMRTDQTLLTGEAAQRRAVLEPGRVAREFKRRLGDSTPILLGGSPWSAEALTGALLRSVVDHVSTREGGPPAGLCLTHPANWGSFKTDLLRQSVELSGLGRRLGAAVRLVSEPQAAATHYAVQQHVPPGAAVAVYDLGGGTFDAAVLRVGDDGLAVVGHPEGVERLGGIDFDAAVFAHVVQALGRAFADLDEDDPAAQAAVARLREECVQAKEALSADTDVAIPVLLPGVTTEVRLTRGELEAMVRPALAASVESLRRAVSSAELQPADLHSVLLVGGSSRIPLVAQLVAELGRPVAVDAHPKDVVALGAALLAPPLTSGSPAHRPSPPGSPSVPTPPPPPPPPPPTRSTPPVPSPPVPSLSAASPSAASLSAASPSAASPSAASSSAASSSALPVASGTPLPAPFPVPPAAGGRRSGSGRIALVAAGVVVLAAAGAAVAAAYAGQDDGAGSGGPSSSASAGDCAASRTAGARWVCLTAVTFDGRALTVRYQTSSGLEKPSGATSNAAASPEVRLFAGDGAAAGSVGGSAGSAVPTVAAGHWLVATSSPVVVPVTSAAFAGVIGRAGVVCVRLADGQGWLKDAAGGYGTGNCLPVQLVGAATSAARSSGAGDGAGAGVGGGAGGGGIDPTDGGAGSGSTSTGPATVTTAPSPSVAPTTAPSVSPTDPTSVTSPSRTRTRTATPTRTRTRTATPTRTRTASPI